MATPDGAEIRTLLELPARGVTLSVLDFGGTGSPLLLCHANGFCGALWRPIARQLARTHRVFAYDARGHGESSKPAPPDPYRWSEFVADLVAVSDHVRRRAAAGGEARVYVVGHSLGAATALEAAILHPERFSRIALLDPPLPPASASSAPRGQAALLAQRRRASFASHEEIRVRYRTRLPFSAWDPSVFELYAQSGFEAQPDGQLTLRCPREIEETIYHRIDIDPKVEELRAPGLVLFAAHGLLPRSIAENLERRAPAMQVADVPAGHHFPMDLPDLTARLLLEFSIDAERRAT